MFIGKGWKEGRVRKVVSLAANGDAGEWKCVWMRESSTLYR